MTDNKSLLLTPFERNLAVWRQLWRTIERSQLVVQIVDARNPLNFRCEDLEDYVREIQGEANLPAGSTSGGAGEDDDEEDDVEEESVDEAAESAEPAVASSTGVRKNLLLVNKADLLTRKQRFVGTVPSVV